MLIWIIVASWITVIECFSATTVTRLLNFNCYIRSWKRIRGFCWRETVGNTWDSRHSALKDSKPRYSSWFPPYSCRPTSHTVPAPLTREDEILKPKLIQPKQEKSLNPRGRQSSGNDFLLQPPLHELLHLQEITPSDLNKLQNTLYTNEDLIFIFL